MSIKHNTKWQFDLNINMSRCTKITLSSGNDIPVNAYDAFIFKMSVFRDEKYSTHRYISYLQ